MGGVAWKVGVNLPLEMDEFRAVLQFVLDHDGVVACGFALGVEPFDGA